jgi:3-methyl-2-oxobutanoate hydroxymethyltransferase
MSKITLDTIKEKKLKADPITLLTAYGFALAAVIDEAGIDIILVGDSVANTELGLESTKSVSMDNMIYHAKAVRRAVKNSLLVGDMPYESYQIDVSKALDNARRFMDEAGCDAIKLEWFKDCPEATEKIIKAGIPVMAHIGLTPQTADELGGFKVQGKNIDTANMLVEQALLLQEIGVFSIVLECIPDILAKLITKTLKIPTIGIGAGPYCDGQALVTYDMLGIIKKDHKPKFVKEYADLYSHMRKALDQYRYEVKEHIFPDKEHSYSMKAEEAAKLQLKDIT